MFKILRCRACIFWCTQNFVQNECLGSNWHAQWLALLLSPVVLGVKLLLRTLFWEWRNCLLIVFKKDTSRNFRHSILKYVLCTYKVNFKNRLLVFVIYVLSHIFPTSWLTLFPSCGKVQSTTLYWCIESINLILIYRNIDIFLIYSDILIWIHRCWSSDDNKRLA